jgi:hypothetical protein
MSVSVKEFLSLTNLKKVKQDLKSFADQNRWEDGKLILSWQGFVENQHVGYGRNGASTLVDLQTILHECEDIDLVRPYGSNSNFMQIYIKAHATAGQAARDSYTRLRIKDSKGSIHTMDDVSVETLTSKFGRVFEPKPVTNYFEGANVLQFSGKTEEVELTETVYSDMVDALKYNQNRFLSLLAKQGFELVDSMEYSHKFSFHPDSVKVLKNSITFSYMTNQTYNSLPVIITIEKTKEFKELSLFELGVETKGSYYSHSDKMTILPEQKEEVMAFKKKFDSLNK